MFARLMGLKVISPDGLQQLKERQPVTVIDVNSHESWAKARVQGAVNLDPFDYEGDDLKADKDANLVFYCSNSLCRKAPHAARRAKKMGYRNVQVMAAGIKGWVADERPTDSGEQEPRTRAT